jgi:hypothetical protein
MPADFTNRDEAIAEIRAALKRRSGRTWSVTGGKGTAWGWITVTTPPARRDEFGCLAEEDRAELSRLMGEHIHQQGVSIPASAAFREYWVERARTGKAAGEQPEAYWD